MSHFFPAVTSNEMELVDSKIGRQNMVELEKSLVNC